VRGNLQALFGKRPTEKDPAKGTSPAVDFTRRAGRGNPPGAIPAGRPGPTPTVPPGHPVSKTTLIRVAGLRWPAEEDFEFGKNCFGLDQSQVRLYTAIARHTVLVMAALAACAVTAALLRDRTSTQAPLPVRPDQPPPADPGMIPLTIPEIARLLAASLPARPPGHAGRWATWRRRHQARSRWLHQRARLARAAKIALAG
jgi:hypothetical protein